ncbi:MAG TPA: glycosyltransferase family 1 protein [Casimicrobiaceae bacterium]|jgi:alpha-1,3-rhamnosyl/mannosyltransferase
MQGDRETRMTVGISASRVARTTEFDGIGVYTQSLEEALQRLGVATRRIGAARWFRGKASGQRPSDIDFPLPIEFALAATAAIGFTMPPSAIEDLIDVYHATDYLVPRLHRTPVVATLYDAIPLAHPEWVKPQLRGVKNWLLRSAARNAAIVIAISNSAVDEIEHYYRIPRERIRVVFPGVDEFWFETTKSSDAQLGSLGIEPGYFLSVGTLQPRKNVESLLAAYDRLPAAVRAEHQLVIVGKYGWGAEALRAKLITRREAKQCLWLDYVDAATLRRLYAGAKAFVFPSLAEGFGLPVLEAMAAGIPVISNDLPVLREVALTLATFVDATNADDLADALQRTAQMSDDSAAAAQRRARAREFTWAEAARRTLDVYREVV